MRHRCEFCILTAVAFASGASNSTINAAIPDASTQLLRVTHPFHPLSGRQLLCVGVRYNRYGKRFLLQADEATVCSVPPQWTDIVAPDPELVMGQRRALFRVADLIELERLVRHLSVGSQGSRVDEV